MARLPSVEKAAQISAEDIQLAEKAWKKDAPPKYKRILDADTIPDPDAERPLQI